MADNAPAPGSSSQGRGGRRRGRGGAPPSGRADAQQNSGEGANRGKSRGRGGKNFGGRDKKNADGARKDTEPTTTAAVGAKQVAAATDDADDGEVCFICASKVEHTSVSPCNHRTCHICALRLRALYKSKSCAHCRVSLPLGCPASGGQPTLKVPWTMLTC